MSLENEAKKLATVHARWFRDSYEALFGSGKEGPVMVIYKRLKEAKNKDDVKRAMSLDGFQVKQFTINDLSRLITEVEKRIETMNDEDSVRFAIEVFKYLQISLFTKISNESKGIF